MSYSDWEQITPKELAVLTDAVIDMRRAEQRMTRINNYSLAALIRQAVWNKHMPSYRSFYREDPDVSKLGTKKEMSDEAMYTTVRALNTIFGGKEE